MDAQSKPDTASSVVIWRRKLDNKSFEICRFIRSRIGFQLSGTILAVHENQPIEIYYQTFCNFDWKTREVIIKQRNGFVESSLKLSVNGGTWNHAERGPLPELAHCIDVDIELTPATNALPINRLKLVVGESVEIRAAWIRVPTLSVIAARQRYDRLSENTYLYTSLASGFQAEIDVDQYGLPVRYGDIWDRVVPAVVAPDGS
jgi:Uncharacterized protein conserved in bacteria